MYDTFDHAAFIDEKRARPTGADIDPKPVHDVLLARLRLERQVRGPDEPSFIAEKWLFRSGFSCFGT